MSASLEKENQSEIGETLKKVESIVDEMNASRLQRIWNRWIAFPVENTAQHAACGAYAFGFWGGVIGSVEPGGGTVAGVATGGGIGAGLGALAGLGRSIGKDARMVNGDSYEDWLRVKAGRKLKKRASRGVDHALTARRDAQKTIKDPAYGTVG